MQVRRWKGHEQRDTREHKNETMRAINKAYYEAKVLQDTWRHDAAAEKRFTRDA